MPEELEHFKNIYKYAHINDEIWQNMYQKASKDSNNKVASNIHLLVFDYLKENMNISIIIDYLIEKIKLFEGESLTTGKRKLNTLFSFIERTNYELTDEDIRYLLERKEISNIFEKIFKKDKITEDKLASITLEDMNYELLCRTYLDSKGIEIVELNDEYQASKERKTLNHNEQMELIKKAQMKDNDALTKLIIYNKGLVNKVAGKYSYRCNECFSFEDLVSVGNMGLLKAIERFDVSKNITFSTYASYWIKQSINRNLDELGTSIRLPVYMTYLKRQTDAYKAYIYQTEGRKVTDEELIKKFDTTAETLKRMHNLPEYTSLDDQVKDVKDGDELKDFIPDEHVAVEEEALNTVNKEELIKAIESLPKEREVEIIKLRFGFTDGNFHTLEEVGNKFDLTRERIRQIEAKAVKKLSRILTSKKAETKKEVEYSKPISNYNTFDYHTIHKDLNKSTYMKLVSILPNSEKSIYCAIRGIKNNNIYLVNEDNIGEKEQKFALLVDAQILEMNIYFSNYQKRKPKEAEENILNKTINYMSKIYLPFRFPEVSQKKLVEIVKKISHNEKEAMYLKHGTSLMEHHQLDDVKKRTYLFNGYNSITKKLNGNNIETSLLLPNKTGLSKEELQKRFTYLSKSYQEILVIRHGKNLDELLPFNSKEYHNQYTKYIRALKEISKEPFIFKNKKDIKSTINNKKENHSAFETGLLLTNKTNLSLEELQKRFKYLNDVHQEILVIRHGQNLDKLLPFDSKKYKFQHSRYSQALQVLTKEPFIYENKKELNVKETSNKTLEELTNLPLTELQERLTFMRLAQQKALTKRFGPNLDQVLPYENNKHYQNCWRAVKHIKNISVENDRIIDNKTLVKITNLSLEELSKRLKCLYPSQQQTLIKRFGPNLNQVLPYEDKKHYINCLNAIKAISKEPFIYKERKRKIPKNRSKIGDKTLTELTNLSLPELQKRLKRLHPSQQKALTKRFGSNLDQVLPYENNRHYQNCWRAVKHIKNISVENDRIIDNKTLVKITNLSLEELSKRLKCLYPSQQKALTKRFGPNLDQVLPYENNRHYQNCWRSIKIIKKEPFDYKPRKVKRNNKDKTLVELTNLSLSELQKRLESLLISQQQTLIKRFGQNLDQILPYENKKHYANCINAIKAISKEPFIYKERKTKVTKKYNKIGDKTLTEITNLSLDELQKRLRSLRISQQQTLIKRFGPNLDQILPYEDKKHYRNCWNNIKFIMQEPFEYKEKNTPKKSTPKKKEIKNDEKSEVAIYFESKIKPFSYQEIIKEIPELSKEDQDIIYMRHGSSVNKILPFKKDHPLSYYQGKYQIVLNNLAKIVRRKRQEQIILETINSEKAKEDMQIELKEVKENKIQNTEIPEVKTANRVVKETNNVENSNKIKDKKESLKKAKDKLTKQSQKNIENQIKAKIYDKFKLTYQNLIDEKYLEKVINESYKECIEKENTNLELSLNLKVERNILLYLKEIYNNNKENDKGLELAISIEDIIYNSLKERYSYISEKDLRSAISNAFINFSGTRSINIDIALILKKQR